MSQAISTKISPLDPKEHVLILNAIELNFSRADLESRFKDLTASLAENTANLREQLKKTLSQSVKLLNAATKLEKQFESLGKGFKVDFYRKASALFIAIHEKIKHLPKS
jgi:hypothetical protein